MTVRIDSELYYQDGTPVLFQEQLVAQGHEHLAWALAVGAVVMSRTGRRQGFPVIETLVNEWSPLRCVNTRDQSWAFRQLVTVLRPSGLMEPKALRIQFVSGEYLSGKPPDHWVHVGEYARDSVLIFTSGKYIEWYQDRLPKDGHLTNYVLRRRAANDEAQTTRGLEGRDGDDRDTGVALRPGPDSVGGG